MGLPSLKLGLSHGVMIFLLLLYFIIQVRPKVLLIQIVFNVFLTNLLFKGFLFRLILTAFTFLC
jgi:hypothetical protein